MCKKVLFLFLSVISSYSQITGCTDPLSENFNPLAIINDGSCLYNFAKIKHLSSITLSDSLMETSGLVAFNNLLWTHNDDQDTTVYGIDENGQIQKKNKHHKSFQ